jgi:hypothetical protein
MPGIIEGIGMPGAMVGLGIGVLLPGNGMPGP